MVRSCRQLLHFACVLFAVSTFGLVAAGAESGQPDAKAIFDKTVQRARAVADAEGGAGYLFDKRTTIERLDGKGRVERRDEKLFLVTMRGGVPAEKLVALNGRTLSESELRREEEKAARWRRQIERSNDGQKRRSFVPADLADRFDLRFERTELLEGRQNHVLSFHPKASSGKGDSFADRVAGRLRGTVWIDATDSEIARLEIELVGKVTLWGGLLMSLDEFKYSLERGRSSGGVWFNQASDIRLNMRGLFKRLRMHIEEKSGNFRLEGAEEMK